MQHKIDVIEQYVGTAKDFFSEQTAQSLFVVGRMIADQVGDVADSIQRLGNADAATSMGALEAVGAVFKEGLESIASNLTDIATEIGSAALAKREEKNA